MRNSFIGLTWVVIVFGSTMAISAEMRTWTDQKGRTLEGELRELDGTEAVILLNTGNVVRVDRTLLSDGDNKYLDEQGAKEEVVVPTGDVGEPEKDAKIDTKSFVELEEPFVFPETEIQLDAMQTEHFLVLTDGSIRPKDIAETAERMWHGMAFQHPGFTEKWGEERRAIFVLEDSATHAAIGEWFGNYLEQNGQREEAVKVSMTWSKASGGSLHLPAEAIAKYKLMKAARIFKVTDSNKSAYKKVFTPFVTNCLANDMISTQMEANSGFGSEGRFAIVMGHAYYKEIQLAGESGTAMITAEYDSDEIKHAKGFANGTSWARELKKLVRKGDVVPSIEKLYGYSVEALKPEELVLSYSFSYFMQSEMSRLTNYTKMIAMADSSRKIPAPAELAKIFGFETVEELETAWTEFIKSTDFKD